MEKMATEHVALLKRAEDAERELLAMKLARRMEEKNLHPELSFEQKVAELRNAPPERLAVIEGGIEFAAGNHAFGKVASHTEGGEGSTTSGDPLDAFVMSQTAFGV